MEFQNNMIDEIIENKKNEFNYVENNFSNGIALFGAGINGEWCLDYLHSNGLNVNCFIDNSLSMQNTKVKGIPVYSYDNFIKNYSCPILITAKHAVLPIMKLLENYDIKMSFDAWFYFKNKDKYDEIENVFKDDKSKQVLWAVIKTMQTGDEIYCANVCEKDQYFCLSEFTNRGDEVFVDAGAYVGDTIEKFIWKQNGGFRKIFAFEPGIKQFEALGIRLERILREWAIDNAKVKLYNAALGESNKKSFISSRTELMQSCIRSADQNSSQKINIYTMDELFKDEKISFIKSDIEGSEISMLNGAKETIQRNKPKMALSAYHRPDDLFNILHFCQNTVPEYKFKLRHHSPMLVDTTIYCYI